jgi:hypothetical protein
MLARTGKLVRLLSVVVVGVLVPVASASAATIHVDGASLAGRCSDSYSRAQAGSALTPVCSIGRGVALAVSGDVVDVRAGSYPRLTIAGRDMAAQTVVRAHVGERPVLAGFRVESSDRWTIQGFRTGAEMSLVQYGSREVRVVGNEFSRWGLTAKHSYDLVFEGNFVHDTRIEGTQTESEGYGFRATRNESGTRVVRPVVRGNRFERIHADAIQFGSTDDPVVDGNVARDIRDISNVGEHNDFVQCYPSCPGLVLRGNDVDGAHQGCMCGDANGGASERVVIEGNRFVRVRQIALNVYDMPGVRIENNTIWSPGGTERRPLRLRDPNRAITGALIRGNIFFDDYGNEAGWDAIAQADFNLYPVRESGKSYGAHDSFGTPTFTGLNELAASSKGIDSGWRTTGRSDDPAMPNRGGTDGAGYGDNGWVEQGSDGPDPEPDPTPEPEPTPPPDVVADAKWSHSPSSPRVGGPVRFDGTASAGNLPLGCVWEFTDAKGTKVFQTRTGCVIDFAFESSGTKYVRLRVKDADGDADSDLHSLIVTP